MKLKLNASVIVCVCVTVLLLVSMGLSAGSGADMVLRELSDLPGYRRVGGLDEKPPEQATRNYCYIKTGLKGVGADERMFDELVSELLRNPGIRDYLVGQLDELPHSYFNSDQRRTVFQVLGDIRTEWSVKALGKMLIDETPLSAPDGMPPEAIAERIVESGGGGTPSFAMAANALDKLDLKNAPTKLEPGSTLSRDQVEQWKRWWRDHEQDLAAVLAPDEVHQGRSQKEDRAVFNNASSRGDDESVVSATRPSGRHTILWLMVSLGVLAVALVAVIRVTRRNATTED